MKTELACDRANEAASIVRKVLLYFPRWYYSGNVGDTVMISSLFKALKSVYPSSFLEVVSDEVVNSTFYNDPYVDSFRLPNDEERKIPLWLHELLGGRKPRKGKLLSWFRRGAAKRPISIEERVPLLHFHIMPQWKTALFEHLGEPENLTELIRAPYKNIISLNFALQTSEDVVNFPDLRPRIYLTEEEIEWGREKIGPNAMGVNLTQIRDNQKRDDGDELRYKKSSWKEFVEKVKKYDPTLRIYEIGQARSEGIGDEFLPNGTIRETAALVHAMKLVVLSDGGLHNICNAVDKEVLLFQAYEWNPPDLFKMGNALFNESYHTECRKQCDLYSEILKVPDMKKRCSKACYDLNPSALADDCIGFLKRTPTSSLRQMKIPSKSLSINFVSHLHPFHYFGGGEQFTNRLISEGFSRGHRIKIVAMKPDEVEAWSIRQRPGNPDLWILFDVFNCPEQKQFSREFIDEIISSSKYIIGQNAYGDICYLNALPCNGKIGDGSVCVGDKDWYRGFCGNCSGWRNGYCPVNDNRKLFTGALLNVFLSPLHASIFHGIYQETMHKTYILKPLVDVDMFFDKGLKRDIKYASYGGGGETKGFNNIRDRFPNDKVVFIGGHKSLARKYGYGTTMGRIPYQEMPDFLNRVENLVQLPRWPEPHGLIINQAALCGCKIIANDMVGACTHDFDMLDRSAYAGHATEFWETVEKLA